VTSSERVVSKGGSKIGLAGRLLFVAGVAALVGFVVAQGFADKDLEPASRPKFVAGEILVGFRDASSAETVVADHGDSILRGVISGVLVVAVKPGDERVKATEYRADPRVEYADLNHLSSVWKSND
jgi:hypothetical protein